METFEALRARIAKCDRCGLRAGCTQVVPGEGSENAVVAFFGEGPGEKEDEKGRPFVGRTGTFLRDHLRRSQIIQDYSILIDNTVRCRPPDNRDPTPEEIESCWPWTVEVLKVVRPRVVVPLGRPALTTLARKYGFSRQIGQEGIVKLAGTPIYLEERGFYVYPMFHPSYAVRRNDSRHDFGAHIEYLRQALPGWLQRPI
jgi:DNA polymerase